MKQQDESSTTTLADRMRGAIWGQFVGDAACLGSHWIYDLAELAWRFPTAIQGFETPMEKHYHYGRQSGDLTHYGDAALLMLESVAHKGCFDPEDFGCRYVALMDSDSYSGYRDHSTKGTLARYREFREAFPTDRFDFQRGADDDQPATVTRLAPVVVVHWLDERLDEVVAKATRVTQDNDRAIAYVQAHALILRHLFSGSPLEEAAAMTAAEIAGLGGAGQEVATKITNVLSDRSSTVTDATLRFGQSCPLASSFPAALYAALVHQGDFSAAILATARAGGDNAGRAAMIGAWLGAALGIGAIPAEWLRRLTAADNIEAAVERILARWVPEAIEEVRACA